MHTQAEIRNFLKIHIFPHAIPNISAGPISALGIDGFCFKDLMDALEEDYFYFNASDVKAALIEYGYAWQQTYSRRSKCAHGFWQPTKRSAK